MRWRNRWLQIAAEHRSLSLSGRRVLVKRLPDGRLIVQHQGQNLAVKELPARPAAAKVKRTVVNNRRWKPPADHPWNRSGPEAGVPRVSPAPAAPARDSHAEKKRKAR